MPENDPEVGSPDPAAESGDLAPTSATEAITPELVEAVQALPQHLQSKVLAVFEQRFSGPMPLPLHVAQYDAIIPGAGNRLLVVHEENARVSREIKLKVAEATITDRVSRRAERKLGQIFGLIICLTVIICGTVTVCLGHPVAGSVFALVGLSPIVAVFINGQISDSGDKKVAADQKANAPSVAKNQSDSH